MNKMRKFLLGAGLALFVALVIWAVTTVPEPPDKPEQPAQSANIMSYDGNEISEEKDGRKIWDLTEDNPQEHQIRKLNQEKSDYSHDKITFVFHHPLKFLSHKYAVDFKHSFYFLHIISLPVPRAALPRLSKAAWIVRKRTVPRIFASQRSTKARCLRIFPYIS